MPGFWVRPEDVGENYLILRDDEVRHLLKARRYRQGDEVEAVDGEGFCYWARIVRIGADEVEAEILARMPEKGESPVRLLLASALLKGQRFDFVVEKATEVGVAAIWPLVSDRVVLRSDLGRKLKRWERLARAATKQCGRSRVPQLEVPRSLDEVLVHLMRECDAVLLAMPDAVAVDADMGKARKIGLLVGPEGGFDPDEVDRVLAAGVVPFSWGERVLRADTASVVLAALALHSAEEVLKNNGGQLG